MARLFRDELFSVFAIATFISCSLVRLIDRHFIGFCSKQPYYSNLCMYSEYYIMSTKTRLKVWVRSKSCYWMWKKALASFWRGKQTGLNWIISVPYSEIPVLILRLEVVCMVFPMMRNLSRSIYVELHIADFRMLRSGIPTIWDPISRFASLWMSVVSHSLTKHRMS